MGKTILVTTENTLREQVFAISHLWYLPVLAFLLGSLAGWLFSYLIPTPYRAQALLSVAFNGDFTPRNPDDYKNWNLEQLNELAVAPDVVQETLSRLQALDPFWAATTIEDLRSMLALSWRNTGEWRLQVETNNPKHAVQAAGTWQEVFLEKYQQASTSSAELLVVDRQIRSITIELSQAKRRLEDVNRASTELSTWQAAANRLPGNQPIDQLAYWHLWSVAARAAGFDPAWKSILSSFPAQAAPRADFYSWADQFGAMLASEASNQQGKIQTLTPEGDELWPRYLNLSEASRGISSTLFVEKAINTGPEAEAIRPGSITALVGGVLGLIAWGLFWLARFSSKGANV